MACRDARLYDGTRVLGFVFNVQNRLWNGAGLKLDSHTQEWIMYGLVALSGGRLLWRLFRQSLAPVLAKLLLKRGKVKWAMRLNSLAANCHH